LYVLKRWGTEELASLRRALQIAALPEDWKEYFRERMQKMNVERRRCGPNPHAMAAAHVKIAW